MSMVVMSGLLRFTGLGDNVSKIEQIIEQCNFLGIKSPEAFAQQIVGETILQILATDHRHAQFTTFDKAAIDGATQRIITNINKHWDFK